MKQTRYQNMEIQWLSPKALLAVGKTLGSNATVLIGNSSVVLVDCMGSTEDARSLAFLIRRELQIEVSHIVMTHYFSDHMAALKHFPEATVISHSEYQNTFDSETNRSAEEEEFFRKPTYIVDDVLELKVEGFQLNIFHNPGYTPCMLNVDIPVLDAVHGGDTAVGNLVFLPYANIDKLRAALQKLIGMNRSHVILSHGLTHPPDVLKNALFYLDTFLERVGMWERSGRATAFNIPIEKCLSPGALPNPDEAGYHARNVALVRARPFDA